MPIAAQDRNASVKLLTPKLKPNLLCGLLSKHSLIITTEAL